MNRLKKLSIQWKVSLATSFYIFLVLILSIFLSAYTFEQKLFNEKHQGTIDTISNIIESYKDYFVLRKLDKLSELVDKLQEIDSVKEVSILDTEGRIIAHTVFSKLGHMDDLNYVKIKDEKIPFFETDGDTVKYFYPLTIEDENIGYAIITYDKSVLKSQVVETIRNFMVKSLFISLFVLTASFLGTFIIAGVMISPLKDLKKNIVNILSKEKERPFHAEIDVKPKDIDTECIKGITNECWLGSKNANDILLSLGEKSLQECSSCEKYKQTVKDEIEQLSCSFYMMVVSLQDYLNKLEEAHKERETLNCMATMGEMSAKVAHEIKNALYAIGNAATYLKNNVQSELVKEFSGIIKDEVNRLNEMTVSFLNFSKLIEPKFQKGDLNKVIEESISLLKDDLDYHNITLELDLDPNLPEFKFDKNLIKQVLFNFALNSIEALEEKNPEQKIIKIKTELIEDGDDKKIRLSFYDNGIGIKEEDKSKIFKPFFTTKQKGTGLGLPMIYKIVYSHNGIVYTESKYGQGTTFYIEFKL